MRPARRELINALFVLVLASLIHAAFEAFNLHFDVRLWALIMMGIAIAVSGYVIFEVALRLMVSTEDREKEWLKRMGTPARLELDIREGEMDVGARGAAAIVEAQRAMSPGSDFTVMNYYGSAGGKEEIFSTKAREKLYRSILELQKRGTIREYKRIICFDNDVLANDHELKSGVLRVGEGPGTIPRAVGDHCRLMMATKGCSLYVAHVIFRAFVAQFGVDKVAISVETVEQSAGGRSIAGFLLFSDPPNGEIIEQFRQIERATEKRMVAVREIRFPEGTEPTADRATL